MEKITKINFLDGFEFLVRLKNVHFIWTNFQFNWCMEFNITIRKNNFCHCFNLVILFLAIV